MITRRIFVAGAALAPVMAYARPTLAATGLAKALASSKLVYLTPLKSNGEESRCKAEIWFAVADGDIFVVTPPDAWRAQAVSRGLPLARMWVGEFGVWTSADGAFRQAPEIMTRAALETDPAMQARVLENMGAKYANDGWQRWGPRFKQGLADGGRVMIRYVIDA